MASCAICKTSILFGGQNIAGVRYCSKRCGKKGLALALTPDTVAELTKPGLGWVFFWAVLAITLAVANFTLDIGSWPKGAVPPNAIAGATGFALGPFMLAGVCAIWNRYRNLHSLFKVAGILGFLLMISAIGRITKPPRTSMMTTSSSALAWVEQVNPAEGVPPQLISSGSQQLHILAA